MADPLQLILKPQPERTDGWAWVEDDLAIVRATRVNLLIIGPDSAVNDVLRCVIADVPFSITVSPSATGRLPLPPLPVPGSILVLRNIDELGTDGQTVLFEWLERADRRQQLVCTGSPLLPSLVTSGEFDSRLYYRLNTVCINLSDS